MGFPNCWCGCLSCCNCAWVWNMDWNMVESVGELKDELGIKDKLPVFVQVGFNRFPIDEVVRYKDHILLRISQDADNE